MFLSVPEGATEVRESIKGENSIGRWSAGLRNVGAIMPLGNLGNNSTTDSAIPVEILFP